MIFFTYVLALMPPNERIWHTIETASNGCTHNCMMKAIYIW
jgi:hypothetical protein